LRHEERAHFGWCHCPRALRLEGLLDPPPPQGARVRAARCVSLLRARLPRGHAARRQPVPAAPQSPARAQHHFAGQRLGLQAAALAATGEGSGVCHHRGHRVAAGPRHHGLLASFGDPPQPLQPAVAGQRWRRWRRRSGPTEEP
jgi:hypothetical protein